MTSAWNNKLRVGFKTWPKMERRDLTSWNVSVCHESKSGRENNVYLYTAETVCMLSGNLVISKLFFNQGIFDILT